MFKVKRKILGFLVIILSISGFANAAECIDPIQKESAIEITEEIPFGIMCAGGD